MDDKLIQEITREVVKRLGSGGGSAKAAPVSAGGRIVAVFTGGDQNLDAAFAQVRALKDGGAEIVLILSPAADKIIGADRIRRETGASKVIASWRELGDMRALLREVNGIVAPVITLNTLAKVVTLEGDNLVANVIIQALLRGKPVVMASDSIICCEATNPPAGVRAKLDALYREAAQLGIAIVPAAQLAATYAAGGRPAAGSASVAAPAAGGTTITVCSGDAASCSACGKCVVNLPQRVDSAISAGASRIGAGLGTGSGVTQNMARYIDHTLLKATATREEVLKLCAEAKQYTFASVCVNTHWVKLCAEQLAGTPVKVCTVVGFPLGAMSIAGKAAETMAAIADGAGEIDMVLNIGALKSGDLATVKQDIAAVVQAAQGRVTKVILETSLLTDKEKVIACQLSKEAGAHFVKTSTGFSTGGATIADIALMRQTVGPEMGVKASGGVRDREGAEDMIRAGATRIGASASIAIVQGKPATGSGY